MKRALIFGITGQDGSYLAELLLRKGYEVHGLVRRSSTGNLLNIRHIADKLILHRGDLSDATSIYRVIREARPHELYNEADQDHVRWSYDAVGYSCDVTGAAVGRILETVRQVDPSIRYFQPCSSNMFGVSSQVLTEESALRPQSPYGCAKVLAFTLSRFYRDVFGMFASSAIFFNHESPRRSEDYVTRKITKAAARISFGLQSELVLGDLEMEIDFGCAEEYMEAAWQILQLEQPDDFIICTGRTHSLRDVVRVAFEAVGLHPERYVRFDEALKRPGKTGALIGSARKAKQAFGFSPKMDMPSLIHRMVEHDLAEAARERKG